jgi:hypothetical protein
MAEFSEIRCSQIRGQMFQLQVGNVSDQQVHVFQVAV